MTSIGFDVGNYYLFIIILLLKIPFKTMMDGKRPKLASIESRSVLFCQTTYYAATANRHNHTFHNYSKSQISPSPNLCNY
jgi:hypothetical protein